MYISVVIPTYNRKPILEKCLKALENQQFTPGQPLQTYEVVLVDDGSTDGTVAAFKNNPQYPHLRILEQSHQGPAAARNLGVQQAQGDTIIFIDSDLVVTESFLHCHATTLQSAYDRHSHRRFFTYGAVINTANFENPTQEPYKITDFSAAYFATGNVAIDRHWLEKVGLFDTQFQLYGWEDLELGVRLKKEGLTLIKCPAAVGYHWHPAFCLNQIPSLIDKEIERGRMGVLFYQKHPTWNVRLMIQMTPLHQVLWGLLSLGGRLNEKTLAPLLQWLIDRNQSQFALEIARIFLNWYNVKGVYAAYREWKYLEKNLQNRQI
jgi:glycosyltransferase involved in cell wall biosynthesis